MEPPRPEIDAKFNSKTFAHSNKSKKNPFFCSFTLITFCARVFLIIFKWIRMKSASTSAVFDTHVAFLEEKNIDEISTFYKL